MKNLLNCRNATYPATSHYSNCCVIAYVAFGQNCLEIHVC